MERIEKYDALYGKHVNEEYYMPIYIIPPTRKEKRRELIKRIKNFMFESFLVGIILICNIITFCSIAYLCGVFFKEGFK